VYRETPNTNGALVEVTIVVMRTMIMRMTVIKQILSTEIETWSSTKISVCLSVCVS
jgi:hypothetical protein